MEPLFLALDEILAIHKDRLDRYSGLERIRDVDLLKSAASMAIALPKLLP